MLDRKTNYVWNKSEQRGSPMNTGPMNPNVT
jgi:hypothetical protein